MKNNTGKILEFDPVIYPGRLWVAINPSFEDIDKDFYFLNEETDEVVDMTKRDFDDGRAGSMASTYIVARKTSIKWRGPLVVIWERKECGAGVCAHEAEHAYDFWADSCGLMCYGYRNGEPRAYFKQWIANCIDRVIRGRVE